MHTDIEELVVFCSECGHSEFVHADRGLPCLFSDCDCSGFDVSVQV
jgi:predicted nucleic-acid-binding Zn-ribbon protein